MAAFDEWLCEIKQRFTSLPKEQRKISLETLVAVLNSEDLYTFSNDIQNLLKRDFISQLPIEIARLILSNLETAKLLECCQVNSAWKHIITSYTSYWRDACQNIGLLMTDSHPADGESLVAKYVHGMKMLDKIQNEEASVESTILEEQSHTRCLFFENGLLAVGCDNVEGSVRIWDMEKGCVLKQLTLHSATDIKIDYTHFFTTSFDATAACWDSNGKLIRKYTGHVSAVLSVDYSKTLDLVVTSSADATIKIWRLSNAALLKTLKTEGECAWGLNVMLYEPPVEESGESDNSSRRDTCTRSRSWERSKRAKRKQDSEFCIISKGKESLELWHMRMVEHNITVMSHETWRKDTDFELLPGLHCRQGVCSVAVSRRMYGTVHIHFWDLNKIPKLKNVQGFLKDHLETSTFYLDFTWTAKSYLGSGSEWHAFIVKNTAFYFLYGTQILPRVSQFFISFRAYFESSFMSHPTSAILCDKTWLDGFDFSQNYGPLLAACAPDGGVHLLKWKFQDKVA